MAFRKEISNTLIILCCLQILAVSYSSELTIVNNCNFTIWPAVLSSSGTEQPSSTGFSLQAGESTVVKVPGNWSGRILGRTFCSHDSNGSLSCLTGDCGSSSDECHGGNVEPPATLAEFFMNRGGGGLDLFYVSLVEGYNIPMSVEPLGGRGTGNCTVTECVMNLNTQCPSKLKVTSDGKALGCKNPCQAFGDTQSCCTLVNSTTPPETCKPSSYALFFKISCPHARLSLYDQTPVFSCLSTNYFIKFCPSYSSSYTEPQNRENSTKKFNWRGLVNIFEVVASMATIFRVAYKFFHFVKRLWDGMQVESINITAQL